MEPEKSLRSSLEEDECVYVMRSVTWLLLLHRPSASLLFLSTYTGGDTFSLSRDDSDLERKSWPAAYQKAIDRHMRAGS